MLSQKAKDLFAKLEMDYPAVAIKYSYAMPENTTHTDKTPRSVNLSRKRR